MRWSPGGLTVAGVAVAGGPFWLMTFDTTDPGIDMSPPGVTAAATATTVRKATAVKSTPWKLGLGTRPIGRRPAVVAQRACRARGAGPTQVDEPCRIIQARAA